MNSALDLDVVGITEGRLGRGLPRRGRRGRLQKGHSQVLEANEYALPYDFPDNHPPPGFEHLKPLHGSSGVDYPPGFAPKQAEGPPVRSRTRRGSPRAARYVTPAMGSDISNESESLNIVLPDTLDDDVDPFPGLSSRDGGSGGGRKFLHDHYGNPFREVHDRAYMRGATDEDDPSNTKYRSTRYTASHEEYSHLSIKSSSRQQSDYKTSVYGQQKSSRSGAVVGRYTINIDQGAVQEKETRAKPRMLNEEEAFARLCCPSGSEEPVWMCLDASGNQEGPFSGSQLRERFLTGGEVKRDALVCGIVGQPTPGRPLMRAFFQPLGDLLDSVREGGTFQPLSINK